MPKYDYKCDECEAIIEVTHPMEETRDYYRCADVVLELDGTETLCEGYLHKMFTPTPGHFKGGGWGKIYGVHKGKQIDG